MAICRAAIVLWTGETIARECEGETRERERREESGEEGGRRKERAKNSVFYDVLNSRSYSPVVSLPFSMHHYRSSRGVIG